MPCPLLTCRGGAEQVEQARHCSELLNTVSGDIANNPPQHRTRPHGPGGRGRRRRSGSRIPAGGLSLADVTHLVPPGSVLGIVPPWPGPARPGPGRLSLRCRGG